MGWGKIMFAHKSSCLKAKVRSIMLKESQHVHVQIEINNLPTSWISKEDTNKSPELIDFKDHLIQKWEDNDAQLSGMKRRHNTEAVQTQIPLVQQYTMLLYPGQAAIVTTVFTASRHLVTLHLRLFVQLIFPTLLIIIPLTDWDNCIK